MDVGEQGLRKRAELGRTHAKLAPPQLEYEGHEELAHGRSLAPGLTARDSVETWSVSAWAFCCLRNRDCRLRRVSKPRVDAKRDAVGEGHAEKHRVYAGARRKDPRVRNVEVVEIMAAAALVDHTEACAW